MALETIPFSELEKITPDTFEAIVVMSKRARQVNAERLAKMELPAFMEEDEEDLTFDREDLEDIDFDGIEKPTTFAVREMMDRDLSYRHKGEGEPSEGSEESTDAGDSE
jgi:DNA-directed RNA polymerase subunit K/omega